jgi:23S rRNA (uridine2552-2'-O)-methyltransferase
MADWRLQRRQDHYYKEAKKHGYRARSAYKILQIHRRYGLFKQGDTVVDLGASPGGWSQVAARYAGHVIAVDRAPMNPLENVTFIAGDITDASLADRIRELAPSVDVVLSDAAPNISGHYTMDQAKSVWLCENALRVATALLRPGGSFVCKIFEGEDYPGFLERVKERFSMVKPHAPKASRKQSSEIYIVAKGFRPKPGRTPPGERADRS